MVINMRWMAVAAVVLVASLAGPWRADGALVSVEANGPTVLLTPTTSAADPTLVGTVIADTTGDFFGLNFKGT